MEHKLQLGVDGVPQTVALADKVLTGVGSEAHNVITGVGGALVPWNELLLKSMQSLISSAGDATNFMVGQIPDVLQQVVLWFLVYNLVLFLVGVTILIVTTVVYIKYSGAIEGKWSLTHDNKGNFELHSIIPAIVYIGVILYSVNELINLVWLQWIIAPKMALISYGIALGQAVVK